MKKKDIIERTCAYCERSTRLIDSESAICKYKGAVSLSHSCRRFVFDPLKYDRAPQRLKITKMETL